MKFRLVTFLGVFGKLKILPKQKDFFFVKERPLTAHISDTLDVQSLNKWVDPLKCELGELVLDWVWVRPADSFFLDTQVFWEKRIADFEKLYLRAQMELGGLLGH